MLELSGERVGVAAEVLSIESNAGMAEYPGPGPRRRRDSSRRLRHVRGTKLFRRGAVTRQGRSSAASARSRSASTSGATRPRAMSSAVSPVTVRTRADAPARRRARTESARPRPDANTSAVCPRRVVKSTFTPRASNASTTTAVGRNCAASISAVLRFKLPTSSLSAGQLATTFRHASSPERRGCETARRRSRAAHRVIGDAGGRSRVIFTLAAQQLFAQH